MFRVRIAQFGVIMLLGGICLSQYADAWLHYSKVISTDPIPTKLADIEKGGKLPNKHVLLSPHLSLYPYLVYTWYRGKYDGLVPTQRSRVTSTIYPIVSLQHPFAKTVAALERRYGNRPIPKEAWPECKDFTVLIRTRKFHRVMDLPDDILRSDSLRGIESTELHGMDPEEQALIQSMYPNMNLSKVVVIDTDFEKLDQSGYQRLLWISLGMVSLGVLSLGYLIHHYLYSDKDGSTKRRVSVLDAPPPELRSVIPQQNAYEPAAWSLKAYEQSKVKKPDTNILPVEDYVKQRSQQSGTDF